MTGAEYSLFRIKMISGDVAALRGYDPDR